MFERRRRSPAPLRTHNPAKASALASRRRAYDVGVAPASKRREYISLAILGAVLVAAVFVVRKLTSWQRVQRMKRYIPEDLFWSIVLVRLVLPMDVISYVLGLFTDIGWLKYAAATAIGLTPSAFVLAYVGKLPNAYEIITFG